MHTSHRFGGWRWPLSVMASVMLISACTDSEIVFRDRELFNPPPDAQAGFLGYFSQADKQTSCGNCHVGVQAEWEKTDHADAFNTLDASGFAQDFCFGCHTVNQRGNSLTTAAGWDFVADSAYQDVQCESCHGPGLTHVENPDATQPIPSIAVDTGATNGCGECHSGPHHPFVEEWRRSPHAEPVGTVMFLLGRDPAVYAGCVDCHTGQGALKAWGIDAEYAEVDDPLTEHLGITCAVCHDPHGSANDAQLRFPIDAPSQDQNLCMKCHHKRAQPETDAASVRGPHSPEGPLLLGEGAGWFPPGLQATLDSNGIPKIVGTHGTVGNPDLCASCHVSSFTVTDAETQAFTFQATGHLFLAIPCVDSAGIPTADQNCQLGERQFGGCATGGCHGSPAAARSAFLTARQRIDALVTEVDSLLALGGYDPSVERNDSVFTVGDGAWFNARLGELSGTSTHNPFLAEQLLVATITAVKAEFGLASPTGVSLELQLQ